jgi:hypothetical protein
MKLIPINKTCTKCKLEKAIIEFCKNKNSKDGRHYTCKECTNNYRKKWYVKNREALIAYGKKDPKRKLNAKRFRASKEDGRYHVYLLPEDHYCGQTKNIYFRMLHHKHVGNHTLDVDVVMSFDTEKQARCYEAMFHDLGWYGRDY